MVYTTHMDTLYADDTRLKDDPRKGTHPKCIKCGAEPIGYWEPGLEGVMPIIFLVDCGNGAEWKNVEEVSCITVRAKTSEEAWALWDLVNRPN